MVALLLGDVAGGIRRAEHVLERAALARDLDQPDADADVEDLVLPDEAVAADRAHDVVGDLPGLLERAADQQDAEFVAAETRDGVRVADRFLDDAGDFAQQVVAGEVPALVVDRLEAVEVQVAEHVAAAVRVGDVQRVLQPSLELAAVHEAGQRVMAGLVAHLSRQAADVTDVAHGNHRAVHGAGGVAQRRDRQLDVVLFVACAQDRQCAPAELDPRATGQRLSHRVAERAAFLLVDDVEHLAERAAERLRRRQAGQVLDRLVRVDDRALGIGGQDRFGQRAERTPGRVVGAVGTAAEPPAVAGSSRRPRPAAQGGRRA